MAKLEKLIKEFSKQKKEFSEQAGKLLVNEILELAKAVPNLTAIKWAQYTPYFNDGEACEFSIGEARFQLSDMDDDAGDYEDGFDDLWSMKYNKTIVEDSDEYKALEKIADLIETPELEDILRSLYDDHVEVTIDIKTGKAETDHYDHD